MKSGKPSFPQIVAAVGPLTPAAPVRSGDPGLHHSCCGLLVPPEFAVDSLVCGLIVEWAAKLAGLWAAEAK